MPAYELVLAIKVKTENVDAARALAEKLAAGFTQKGMPTQLQVVQRIRDEELKQGKP